MVYRKKDIAQSQENQNQLDKQHYPGCSKRMREKPDEAVTNALVAFAE